MAATGGNDATTAAIAAIAAGGSEATAPVLSQALYGTQDPSKLTDEQKNTLTTIADLAGTVVGATTGEGTNAVASGQAAQNAVANNYLSYKEKATQIQLKNQLAHCVGVCTQARIDELQTKLDQLNHLDKQRDQDYVNACAGGLNADCGRESGNAYKAYRSYDNHDEVVSSNPILSHEQDKTRDKAYREVTNNEAESLELATANAEALGNTLIGSAVAGAKAVGYIKGALKTDVKAGAKNTDFPDSFSNQFPEHQTDIPHLIPETKLKNGSGTYNYVVKDDGSLVIGKKSSELGGGHIDLANGKPVKAAGEVTIVKAEIKKLDNSSGHYEPYGASAQSAAEKAFKDKGFNANGKYIEKRWIDDPNHPNGGSWKPVTNDD